MNDGVAVLARRVRSVETLVDLYARALPIGEREVGQQLRDRVVGAERVERGHATLVRGVNLELADRRDGRLLFGGRLADRRGVRDGLARHMGLQQLLLLDELLLVAHLGDARAREVRLGHLRDLHHSRQARGLERGRVLLQPDRVEPLVDGARHRRPLGERVADNDRAVRPDRRQRRVSPARRLGDRRLLRGRLRGLRRIELQLLLVRGRLRDRGAGATAHATLWHPRGLWAAQSSACSARELPPCELTCPGRRTSKIDRHAAKSAAAALCRCE